MERFKKIIVIDTEILIPYILKPKKIKLVRLLDQSNVHKSTHNLTLKSILNKPNILLYSLPNIWINLENMEFQTSSNKDSFLISSTISNFRQDSDENFKSQNDLLTSTDRFFKYGLTDQSILKLVSNFPKSKVITSHQEIINYAKSINLNHIYTLSNKKRKYRFVSI